MASVEQNQDDSGSSRSHNPSTIVIVHGVGNQQRGECLQEFTSTLMQVSASSSDIQAPRAVNLREELIRVDERDSVRLSKLDMVYERNGKSDSVAVWELYWADVSGLAGQTLIHTIIHAWQLLTGLPRLGIRAISPPIREAGFSVSRFFFTCTWVLAILRMTVALVIGICGQVFVPIGDDTTYDVLLPLDYGLAASSLFFCVSLAWDCRSQEVEWTGVRIAPLTLTAMVLLTQFAPLSVKMADRMIADVVSEEAHSEEANSEESGEVDSKWFYAVNGINGLLPFLVVMLLYSRAILVYATYWIRSQRNSNPQSLSDLLAPTWKTMTGLGIIVLAIAPSLLLIDVSTFWVTTYFWESGLSAYPPLVNPSESSLANVLYYMCYAVSVPSVLMYLAMSYEELRSRFIPILDSVLDVINYAPALPWIDRYWVLRRFLGGSSTGVDGLNLEIQLARRVRALLAEAERENRNDVLLVGHSLGTIVCLTGLDGWSCSDGPSGGKSLDEFGVGSLSPVARPKALSLSLVTMGSPLEILAGVYPKMYDRRTNGWNLGGVRDWLNLFRPDDLIGRGVESTIRTTSEGGIAAEDVPCESGGHSDYFSDPKIVKRIAIKWFPQAFCKS